MPPWTDWTEGSAASSSVPPKNRHGKRKEAMIASQRETLQHTQPWLPSSPPSLSSRPASPRPRRAPRARSAPPPSTVSRSRSPRYVRPVAPSVAEKHLVIRGARAIFFIVSRIGARVAGHGRPAGRNPARGARGWHARCPFVAFSPGHPVSRPEGPATGPDPDRSRSGVRRLFPPTSVSRVRRQSSGFFFALFRFSDEEEKLLFFPFSSRQT